MDMVIELVQRIEDNQRMHLGSTLPVFVSALIMTSVPQMAVIFFTAQTSDLNEQLIDRLTVNLACEKLFLAAFGSFFSSLAGGFSPVKIPSKRYTRISPNVVSTTSKSPKIFNNRPVNKLIFSVLTTSITTTTTTSASQMAAKAKNSKKHPLPDMNGNNNGLTPKIDQD
ncbi:hypothetical protein G9A89_016000 [Geosiphon pyriformis]|nr:hypothetical protein G9A89_016000 [Geosiphon pyriformis]